MWGPGAEAVEDCIAVDGVERVDNVNALADPIPAETDGVQAGLECRPRKFACSLPVKSQLGRAERGERTENVIRAHHAFSKKPPEGVADRNGPHSIALLL